MKIVHVSFPYLDGYTYQDNELPAAHARLGHQVTIISTQDYASMLYFKTEPNEKMASKSPYYIDNCKIIRLPLVYKSNYRFAISKGLYKHLVKESPDLIFFHELPVLNFFQIVKYIKRHNNCKLFVDYHCDSNNSANNKLTELILHKFIYRTIINLCDKYVSVFYGITPGTIQFIKDKYLIKSSKTKLLPLGCNLLKINIDNSDIIRLNLRKELRIDPATCVVIFAGKIDKGKRVDNLLKAVNEIEEDINIHLLIIGSIEDDNLKFELEQLANINKRTLFLGWKKPEEIYRYFLASDIACFPGSQSALWQQAICAGLPLVCHYNMPGSEYIDKGNCVFLYSDSIEEITIKIKELVNNSSYREKLRIAALNIGRPYFSYDRIANSIIDDYQLL